uniref:General transcription and DNA repair factor IIH subunit TFB5 n=1 Tax=Hydra vulgaris TaxID=6087 RepID=T2MBD4_HYDVU|nr:TTDA [Hydra vulgaris]
MVNVLKGVLVECDPTVKQFLLHMDEKGVLGQKFVIEDLDSTHLFVAANIIKTLESKLWELMDKLSFPVGNEQ